MPKFHRLEFLHGGTNIWDIIVGGHCRKDKFHGEKHIVSSWFDLEICSKCIKDGTIGQNTYDFLL